MLITNLHVNDTLYYTLLRKYKKEWADVEDAISFMEFLEDALQSYIDTEEK